MRIKVHTDESRGGAYGYTLWLSARDTWAWAHRPGAAWPCSTLEDKRLAVSVDGNGLWDLTVNGRSDADPDSNELAAIVADHLPKSCRGLWPVWGSQA